MRVAIITFPGSNCDYDCYKALTDVIGAEAYFLWHREKQLGSPDAVILPGGFSYGDYLRAGAIARFSPIMPRPPWCSCCRRSRLRPRSCSPVHGCPYRGT